MSTTAVVVKPFWEKARTWVGKVGDGFTESKFLEGLAGVGLLNRSWKQIAGQEITAGDQAVATVAGGFMDFLGLAEAGEAFLTVIKPIDKSAVHFEVKEDKIVPVQEVSTREKVTTVFFRVVKVTCKTVKGVVIFNDWKVVSLAKEVVRPLAIVGHVTKMMTALYNITQMGLAAVAKRDVAKGKVVTNPVDWVATASLLTLQIASLLVALFAFLSLVAGVAIPPVLLVTVLTVLTAAGLFSGFWEKYQSTVGS